MRIALIAFLHGRGGAERQICMLANAMSKRGHEVHMLVLAEYKSMYPLADNIKVHDLTYAEKGLFHPAPRRFWALAKTFKLIKPDVTINYNMQPAWMTALMPRCIYNKSVYSERGDPYDKEYNGITGLFRTLAMNYMDGFVFQSEGARDFFNNSVRKKSVIIHNSVSISQSDIPDDFVVRENYIMTAGRLHEQKNQILLINAFKLIADEFPSIELRIYGDGKLKEELENCIDRLNLNGRVWIYPSRKDIFRIMAISKLFVLSSDYEGMPNALMEAMSLGTPCVSTDCRPGGARTLIDDGVNGFIVPTNDSKALAEKIKYVLSNDEVAHTLSNNGRKLLESHNEKATFDKWEEFLKKIVTQ